jgi:uncharacterized protein (DUF1330 family)
MKTRYAVALAVFTGIGFRAAVVQGLHAQAKPPVYVVNEVDVTDHAGFKTYIENQAKLIEKHGGRYIIRGGKVTAFDGRPPKRFNIYVFDNENRIQAWRNDPAQKDVLGTRDKVAKFRSFAVEGVTQ